MKVIRVGVILLLWFGLASAQATSDSDSSFLRERPDGIVETVFISESEKRNEILNLCFAEGVWNQPSKTLWFTPKPLLQYSQLPSEFQYSLFSNSYFHRNCIVVRQQFTLDQDEYVYVQRYRFQNKSWYLIGSTETISRGCTVCSPKPIKRTQIVDINFSTGKAQITETYSKCRTSSDFYKANVSLPKSRSFLVNTGLKPVKMMEHSFRSNIVKIS